MSNGMKDKDKGRNEDYRFCWRDGQKYRDLIEGVV